MKRTTTIQNRMAKTFSLLLMAITLVACGGDNKDGIRNPYNPYGYGGFGGPNAGFVGHSTVDRIISQTQCKSSMGPQARRLIGFRSVQGPTGPVTQPMTASNINIASLNGVFIGRTTYGDVIVLREYSGARELIISLCHRAYTPNAQVTNISTSPFAKDANSFCGINVISSGTIFLNFGGMNQLTLYPRPPYESEYSYNQMCNQGF